MSSLTDYEDNLLAASPALLAAVLNAAEMGRPSMPNRTGTPEDLEDALMDAVKEDVGYDFVRKENPSRVDAFRNPDDYGYNARQAGTNHYQVKYNPESHPAYLAHEMGHGAAQQSDFGRFVAQARHGDYDNPKLQSLARHARGLGATAAGSIAALAPGDDDLAASLAASYLAASPEIADEVLASLKAEDILRGANNGVMPKGSRARLAGALMTYLTAPAIAGSTANYVGNLMDSEVRPPTNSANVA